MSIQTSSFSSLVQSRCFIRATLPYAIYPGHACRYLTVSQVVLAVTRVFYYLSPSPSSSSLSTIVQPLLRLLTVSKEVERVVLVYILVIARRAPVRRSLSTQGAYIEALFDRGFSLPIIRGFLSGLTISPRRKS